MTTRLPLVAAQPGIWMAERLSTLPGAWNVAHYVELRGALDPALLGKAIVLPVFQQHNGNCDIILSSSSPHSSFRFFPLILSFISVPTLLFLPHSS